MRAFVDTSAFYALLSATDRNHAAAIAVMDRVENEGIKLATSNYILHETMALVQARLGLQAALSFHKRLAPLLEVHWMTHALHNRSVARLSLRAAKKLSLTDCSSFVLMEELGIMDAFVFDRHFLEEGFSQLTGK